MRNIGLDLGNSWYSIGRPEEMNIYESMQKDTINNNQNLINIPFKFSIWDTIIIKGPILVRELLKIFKEEYNFEIDYINANNQCLLDMIENDDITNNEDIDKSIDELYIKYFPNDITNKKYIKLEILGTINDKDIKLSRIKYIINKTA